VAGEGGGAGGGGVEVGGLVGERGLDGGVEVDHRQGVAGFIAGGGG